MGKELVRFGGQYRIREVVHMNLGELWRWNTGIPTGKGGSSTPDTFGENTCGFYNTRERRANPSGVPKSWENFDRWIVIGNRQRDDAPFTSDPLGDEQYICVRAKGFNRQGNIYYQLGGAIGLGDGPSEQQNAQQARVITQQRGEAGDWRTIMGTMYRAGNRSNPARDFAKTKAECDWCFVNEETFLAANAWPDNLAMPTRTTLPSLDAWAKVLIVPQVGSQVILRVPYDVRVFDYSQMLFRDLVYDIAGFTEIPYKYIELALQM